MAMVAWALSSMIQWPSRESVRAPRSHPLHARRIRIREGRRDHQTCQRQSPLGEQIVAFNKISLRVINFLLSDPAAE
jgi:hypothetical protein